MERRSGVMRADLIDSKRADTALYIIICVYSHKRLACVIHQVPTTLIWAEAAFLSLVMDQMVDIDFLRTVNSILVDNILERFPENLQQIASQWHNIIEGGVKSHSFLEACLMTIVDFKLLKGNGSLWCLSIWLPLSPFHRPSRSLGYPCGQGSIRVRSQCRAAVLCGNRHYQALRK